MIKFIINYLLKKIKEHKAKELKQLTLYFITKTTHAKTKEDKQYYNKKASQYNEHLIELELKNITLDIINKTFD